jgi:hypothetical protein
MGDEQTIQCPKNDIWTNNDLQNSTQETKYCWARIPLEIRGWTWVLQNGKQFLLQPLTLSLHDADYYRGVSLALIEYRVGSMYSLAVNFAWNMFLTSIKYCPSWDKMNVMTKVVYMCYWNTIELLSFFSKLKLCRRLYIYIYNSVRIRS